MQRNLILIVDDDPLVLHLTEAILQRAGYEIVSAAHSGDALVLCEELKTRLALIISDVSMPGMNGKELAKCISQTLDHIPVILMSGYSIASPLIEGLVNGRINNNRFIAKPFRPAQLLEIVSEVLSELAPN